MELLTPYGEEVSEEILEKIPTALYLHIALSGDEGRNYQILKAYFQRARMEVPFDVVATIAQHYAYED